MESMSDRLRRLRVENNMTQEHVGKVLGVQKAAINKYETGNVENIKRTSILKLAKLYGVKPSYLLCFDEEIDEYKTTDFHITADEKELVTNYRELSEQGQEYIRQTMFIAKRTYKKTSMDSNMEKQA